MHTHTQGMRLPVQQRQCTKTPRHICSAGKGEVYLGKGPLG